MLVADALFSVSAVPSLNILIETVSRRVGKDLDLVAIGSVFTFGSGLAASLYFLTDYLVNLDGPKPSQGGKSVRINIVWFEASKSVLLLASGASAYYACTKRSEPIF